MLRLGAAVLVTGFLGLLFGSLVTRGVIGLASICVAVLDPRDPQYGDVVATLVRSNRHLLWLASLSLVASSAMMWGRLRHNVAVLIAGTATIVPLLVATFVLLAVARLHGGSQVLTNTAGLTSLLIPAFPLLLIFLRQVRAHEG